MVISLFLTGCLVGFFIALPVGPIGTLCIRNSILHGMTYGLVSGIGAALADTLYGGIAAFGYASSASFFVHNQGILQIIGSIFLWYLGFSIFFSKSPANRKERLKSGYLRTFITTFFLTLTNPITILCFLGIYATCGLGLETHGKFAALVISCGVFIGSVIWWVLLSFASSFFGKKLNIQSSTLMNKISGSLILSFGFLTTLSVLSHFWKGFLFYETNTSLNFLWR